jgi:glycosyltransferase involved in cell wall biosynthesis
MKSLVIVPAYNEKEYISSVIERLKKYHDDILVVDDGSTDGTCEILNALEDEVGIVHIDHHANLGYGKTLIDGFEYAKSRGYDAVVTIDADEQHEPCYVVELLDALPQSDIVSCSRYVQGGSIVGTVPPERQAVNAEITATINRITGYNLTDAFCGLKAYTVPALRRLDLTETGYGMPLQLWIQAAKLGLTVSEIPVCVKYVDPKRSFGGVLDDVSCRLEYYRRVIQDELDSSPVVNRRGTVCPHGCRGCD